MGPRVGLADGLQDGAQVGPRVGAVEGQHEGMWEGLVVGSSVDERLGLAVGRPSQARVCSYTARSKGWSSDEQE